MNERQLFDAIGRVDDDLILASDRPPYAAARNLYTGCPRSRWPPAPGC